MDGKLSRRDFLRGATLTGVGIALAACSSEPEPAVVKETVVETGAVVPETEAVATATAPISEPAVVKETVVETGAVVPETEAVATATAPISEPVRIQYWAHWGHYVDVGWSALKKLDAYQTLFTDNNITVNVVAGVSYDRFQTAVAAGTPPDVGGGESKWLGFAVADVLVPLDDLVAASSIIKAENHLNWDGGFYKGVLYGVPANEGFVRYGLNYNAAMVEAAGLDPDSPPETWSEVMEWHQALTEFDDSGKLKRVGFDPYDAMGGGVNSVDGFFAPVSWGWKWFDADSGQFDLDNEMMAESLDVMGEFYRHMGPDNMAAFRSRHYGWAISFGEKLQAMIVQGYWHPGEQTLYFPEVGEVNRATWAPVPDHRRGAKIQGSGCHRAIIFKGTQHPAAAFKVAEFLNTDAAYNLIFQTLGWLPDHRGFTKTVDPSVYPGLGFYFDSIDEATEWYQALACPIEAFVEAQYIQLRESVYRDEMPASAAAAELQSRCEAEYKSAGFG